MLKFMKRTACVLLTLGLLATGAQAKTVTPNSGPPGSWRVLGTTHANHSRDHDTIEVRGPYDNFRKLKFRVKDAPLNMQRMVVTYDNGGRDEIQVRYNIPQGGESRIIDLRGAGKRSLRRVDFWYDTRGMGRGNADVTLFGMK
ncbi:hypothetical protein R0381_000194 [Jeongeupia wiesaeckerbachi]|uniref:hypothetical protein n=1 Tax=Jeongeupia wiesaeckerbachi TaxID=3051218 RepID=UPI003D80A270